MNRWAWMLADLSPVLQRLIARTQRISLPRNADAPQRVARLRVALCRPAAVRAAWLTLDEAVRAAVRDLAARRGGIRPDDLTRQHGALRPLRDLARDPAPRSITERLVLLGWLLLRPATHRHPARYLVPPELRRALPQPLDLPTQEPAPAPPLPPILRTATSLLVLASERDLPLCRDVRPARALFRRCASMTPDAADPSPADVLPLLLTLGLLNRTPDAATLTPNGLRFLHRTPLEQLTMLRTAWLNRPGPDAWALALLPDRTGIDWPLLRRRLLAWVRALPADVCLPNDPARLFAALSAWFGPLADAHTHGFRRVTRTPWRTRRSQQIFTAALSGPLRWFGFVATTDSRLVHTSDAALAGRLAVPPGIWRRERAGGIVIPFGAEAELPRLLPFVQEHSLSAEGHVYRVTAASLARAARRGYATEDGRALLERMLGLLPDGWWPQPATRAGLRLIHTTLLISETPGLLERAARQRTVRRYLGARPAPGLALVAPQRADALTQALERQGIVVATTVQQTAVVQVPPTELSISAGEGAALLEAIAGYRRVADLGLPPALERLEARLRAALPLEHAPAAWPNPDPPTTPEQPASPMDQPPDPHSIIARLRRALADKQLLSLTYDTGGQGLPTQRLVRPLHLEQTNGVWYLRAFCHARAAERTFRIDRIRGVAPPAAHTPAI